MSPWAEILELATTWAPDRDAGERIVLGLADHPQVLRPHHALVEQGPAAHRLLRP